MRHTAACDGAQFVDRKGAAKVAARVKLAAQRHIRAGIRAGDSEMSRCGAPGTPINAA
jgi:hypothetical protein